MLRRGYGRTRDYLGGQASSFAGGVASRLPSMPSMPSMPGRPAWLQGYEQRPGRAQPVGYGERASGWFLDEAARQRTIDWDAEKQLQAAQRRERALMADENVTLAKCGAIQERRIRKRQAAIRAARRRGQYYANLRRKKTYKKRARTGKRRPRRLKRRPAKKRKQQKKNFGQCQCMTQKGRRCQHRARGPSGRCGHHVRRRCRIARQLILPAHS